ncbi:MAG: YbgC/FadM family acyl-CoA thioesterase, partial [Alphaproteobacteria bacterium]|nr:YbgC/FadM family acyl-CoA thioesterase [Alphaproteobacteria bacterium]
MSKSHRFMARIYWEDTDAAGIVYYANYLRFLERARSDLVRWAGIDQAALLDNEGVLFPVRHCEINYLRPARLDDEIEVRTSIRK